MDRLSGGPSVPTLTRPDSSPRGEEKVNVNDPRPSGSKRIVAMLHPPALRRVVHSYLQRQATRVTRFRSTAAGAGDSMSKFKIKVIRIEAAASGRAVSITFAIDRGTVRFQVPIRLSAHDYDDTEMVQAARSTLHRIFVELAAQSRDWKLSSKDLRQLSGMSRRPNETSGERSSADISRVKPPRYRRRAP
jgi:hypothetical protein